MDLPLPDVLRDMKSIYWLCGLAGLVAVLLVVTLQAISGSAARAGAAKKPRGTATILLVGPMGSGKTSFFSRLVYGSPPATHTSMATSSAIIAERNVQLVDLPGHPRLRAHLLAQHLSSAQGVAFFIDPSTNATTTSIQVTAEHLHVLLALLRTLDEKGARSLPPVLLLLSKSDTWTAAQEQRAQDRVRAALERELEKRRKASAAAGAAGQARLESIEELPSGSSGSPFRFFNFFRGSSASSSKQVHAGGIRLPEDEQEILQSDVLDFDGPFSWEEGKLGVSIAWTTGSAKSNDRAVIADVKKEVPEEKVGLETDAGVAGFWDWVDSQVL